uniref:Uncharacterized protein n=1 Tax=Tanacetum cinerariifolium TaxID=118510 RepID=A0A6L2LYZ6_TANCI|nr:hypothetical protein [Tanacetum cinerariifolium]
MLVIKIVSERKNVFRKIKKCKKIRAKRELLFLGPGSSGGGEAYLSRGFLRVLLGKTREKDGREKMCR